MTIAHRPHVHHVHWMPTLLVVIVAIVAAAALIYAVNQPATTTTTTTSTEVVAPATVGVIPTAAANDSMVRHQTSWFYGQHPELVRYYLWDLHHRMLIDGQQSLQPYATGAAVLPSQPR